MNYITTLIKYPKIPKRKKTLSERRAEWAEYGLCLQCGGERPCNKHFYTKNKRGGRRTARRSRRRSGRKVPTP